MLAASDDLAGVRFCGIQGYHGATSKNVRNHPAIAHPSKNETFAALDRESLSCARIVTGVVLVLSDARMGVFSELQPGSYLFMDADDGRIKEGSKRFEPTSYVASTIISVGDAPKRGVLDDGLKSHSIDAADWSRTNSHK